VDELNYFTVSRESQRPADRGGVVARAYALDGPRHHPKRSRTYRPAPRFRASHRRGFTARQPRVHRRIQRRCAGHFEL